MFSCSALYLCLLLLFAYALGFRPDGVECYCADEDVRYVVRAVRPNGKPAVSQGTRRVFYVFVAFVFVLAVLEIAELLLM